MSKTPVILFGLGPIGQQIGRLAAERADLEVLGAVDVNPALVGKPLTEVLGVPQVRGQVVKSVSELSFPTGAVALHATGSSLAAVAPQLEALAKAGLDVVSTCEELSYPWFHQKELAQKLDAMAKANDVTLVGTGVNPGFAMDTLPLMLTATSRRVDSVKVERRVAAATRREPLQRKIGASLTKEAFERGVKEGKIRHVGLPESAAALGLGLGFKIDKVEERIEPVLAQKTLKTQFLTVEPGQVAGVHQIARGFENGKEKVFLELTMSVDVPASVDKVTLEGEPPMTMTLEGIHGDIATATIALNSIGPTRNAAAGLRTMAELAVVHR
jgi:2,4-diaminopentanoate dehydrogenase